MSDVFLFALLGLGLGALYALASQGLIVIYRGSGVLNFAHGAIGVVGAYLHWELKVRDGPAGLAGLGRQPGGVCGSRRADPPPCHAKASSRLTPRPHGCHARHSHPGRVGGCAALRRPHHLRPVGAAPHARSSLRRDGHHRPFHSRRYRRRREPGSVGDLPLHAVRVGDQRSCRKRAGGRQPGAIARSHRDRQLGLWLGPCRRGCHPHRSDRGARRS